MSPLLLTRCREKTSRRNVFPKARAKREASRMRRETGSPIRWFRCACCGYYHLGGRRCTVEERVWRALRWAMREVARG